MSDPQMPDSQTSNADEPIDAAAPKPSVEVAPAAAATSAPRPAAKEVPRATKPVSSSRPLFLTLAAFIVVAGFGGLLYCAMQQQRALVRLSSDYESLLQARDASTAEINALQQARTQVEQDLRTQLQQVQAAQRTQLADVSRELAALRTQVNDGGAAVGATLLNNEAEALLRLAQERLLLARDLRAAISLMQGADEVLRQVNSPAMFTVREALAQDLATLRAVEAVDVSGLYARLGAAGTRLAQLTVQPGGAVPEFRVETTNADATSTVSSWWDDTLAFLSRYFVITHSASDAIPVLSTEQTWVVKEQLGLQLEAARIALLQGQQAIYERGLDDAISGIDALLQGEDKAALLTELRALRASPVQTTIPPAARGLDALQQLQPAQSTTP